MATIQTFCSLIQTICVILQMIVLSKKDGVLLKDVEKSNKLNKSIIIFLLSIIVSAIISFLSMSLYKEGISWIILSVFLLLVSLGLLVYFAFFVKKRFNNKRIALSKYLNVTVALFSFMILFYTGITLNNCITNKKPILRDPIEIEGNINDVKKNFFFSTLHSCNIKIWKKSEKGDSIINIYGDPKVKLSRNKSKDFLITKVIDTKVFLYYDGEHQEYKVWDKNGEECKRQTSNVGFRTMINDSIVDFVWIKDDDPYDDKRVRFMHSFDGKYGIEIVCENDVEEKINDRLQDKWSTIEYFNEIRTCLFVAESLSEAGLRISTSELN